MKKIVFIQLRALGDTVLITAPILEFMEANPNVEVHCLVSNTWASLFESFPKMRKIWTWDPSLSKWKKMLHLLFLGLQMRKEGFHTVVHFQAHSSHSFLSRLMGAPHRSIHFHRPGQISLFSTVTLPDQTQIKPILERHRDTIRALGLPLGPPRLPQIFMPSKEKGQPPLPQPLLAISLGASRTTKNWGANRFAEVAHQWIEKEKGHVWVVAGENEKNQMNSFLNHAPLSLHFKSLSWSTTLSLREMAGIFQSASVFLGNDSGPKHLAIAVGTPTVTLFGPENPFEWHPYPTEKHPFFFIDPLSCRTQITPGNPQAAWCRLKECIQEGHRCMKDIEVEAVLRKCQELARTQKG